ncbi:MAG: N-6 DNA methylase [Peptostreptococcales bacterium]
MSQNNRIEKIDSYVAKLSKEKDKWISLAIAVDIADEIMKGILPDVHNWHSELNRNSQENFILPDPLSLDTFKTQKQQTWFEQHPVLSSARVALNHFSQIDCPIESRLYWFSDKETKQKVSVTTQFFDNWEDTDLTRKESYKVGIDFFLSADTNKFFMVLTNQQKLRVMEFEDRLSNTQKQILSERLFTLPYYEKSDSSKLPQELIHKHLWDSFLLKEVNNKFYQGISTLHNKLVDHFVEINFVEINDARQFSSRLLGRLLFIWFLRKMGLISENIGYFDTQNSDASIYYEENLKRLFFHTLNKPIKDRNQSTLLFDSCTPYLNGGLFEEKDNDYCDRKLAFPDNYFEELYDHFNKFNFTIDESSVDYQFVAVDPEMLGQIFESLLADQNKTKGTSLRKSTGSYYTRREIVEYMCREAIRQYLHKEIDNENSNTGIDNLIDWTDAQFMDSKSSSEMDLWGVNTDRVKKQILDALNKVKIIDPAVGSGAFPIGMMQLISKLYERLLKTKEYDAYRIKLGIIENNIYGVDIQPMAVEIARLRAWLALIVEERDDKKVHPLPNLEFKFVSANSLESLDETRDGGRQLTIGADPLFQENLTAIRVQYFTEADPERKKILQNRYYKLINQPGFYDIRRITQLKSFDPFANTKSASFFDSEFMFGVEGGFDIVIGNPPYIHFEDMEDEERDYYAKLKYYTYTAQGDIYTLFYEHGVTLLKSAGVLAYITSNKWMRTAYGKKLRKFLVEKTNPIILIDLGEGMFEHATVDTNILILSKELNNNSLLALNLETENINREIKNKAINVSYAKTDPWIILNRIENAIKTKIEKAGVPLKFWDIKIQFGIKTGLNDAFLIDENIKKMLIEKDPNSAEVIRPVLKGENINNRSYKFGGTYLITTHNGYYDNNGKYIKKIAIDDFPAIKEHLDKFEPKLSKRGDKGDTPYHLRSCAYMDDFNKVKIVWPDIVRKYSFALLENPFLILNSAYLMVDMPVEIIGILNSRIMQWYMNQISVGLGKSYRYRKQFVEEFVLPSYSDNLELYNIIQQLYDKNNYEEIDSFLMEYYHFSSSEMEYFVNYLF